MRRNALLSLATAALLVAGAAPAAAQDRGDTRLGSSGAVISLPDVPTPLMTGVDDVSAGQDMFVSLKDGRVRWWRIGQTVQEAGVSSLMRSGVDAIDAGSDHFLALKDGAVYAWGSNTGNKSTVPEAARSNVSSIRAGGTHSLALVRGKVIAWGSNSCGQRTVPVAARSGVDAIRAGSEHSLALKDGAVIAWGCISTVPRAVRSGVDAISAGNDFNLALKNGRVYAWDDTGLLPVPAALDSGVTAMTAGYEHSFARKNGRWIAWGDDLAGETIIPSVALRAPDISAGVYTSVAIDDTGKVIFWGLGSSTPESVPPSLASAVTDIAAGNRFGAAVKNGGVIVWGDSSLGVRSVPTAARSGVTAVAASSAAVMALKGGEVIGWGTGWRTPPPEVSSGVTAIAAGTSHFLALKGGRVYAWGGNTAGQSTVPTGAETDIVAITAGGNLSAGVTSTGDLVAWGKDRWGNIPNRIPETVAGVDAVDTDGLFWIARIGDRAVVWYHWSEDVTAPTIFQSGVTDVSVLGGPASEYVVVKGGRAIRWNDRDGVLATSSRVTSGVIAVDSAFGRALVIKAT